MEKREVKIEKEEFYKSIVKILTIFEQKEYILSIKFGSNNNYPKWTYAIICDDNIEGKFIDNDTYTIYSSASDLKKSISSLYEKYPYLSEVADQLEAIDKNSDYNRMGITIFMIAKEVAKKYFPAEKQVIIYEEITTQLVLRLKNRIGFSDLGESY